MDQIAQHPQDILTDIEAAPAIYSTFWQRFAASFIDGLVLLPITFLNMHNQTTWKNLSILLIIAVVSIAYKPVLEAMYGATVGKMAMKLTIVNYDFKKASTGNILLRNIFGIVGQLAVTIVAIITFTSVNFADVNSSVEYGRLSNAIAYANWVNIALGIIVLADAIVLIADSKKQALHDKIGQTIVIQK